MQHELKKRRKKEEGMSKGLGGKEGGGRARARGRPLNFCKVSLEEV